MSLTLVPTRTFRVVKITRIGTADPTESIVWQGHSTRQLSQEYPPSKIFGADPLGHTEIEGGHIQTDYRFEKFKENAWREIPDPRVRLTPLTALELEIDAENRRRFPGDFIEEEEEYPEYDGDYDCELCHDWGCALCEPEPEVCRLCLAELGHTEKDVCMLCLEWIKETYPEA